MYCAVAAYPAGSYSSTNHQTCDKAPARLAETRADDRMMKLPTAICGRRLSD